MYLMYLVSIFSPLCLLRTFRTSFWNHTDGLFDTVIWSGLVSKFNCLVFRRYCTIMFKGIPWEWHFMKEFHYSFFVLCIIFKKWCFSSSCYIWMIIQKCSCNKYYKNTMELNIIGIKYAPKVIVPHFFTPSTIASGNFLHNCNWFSACG